MYPLNVPVNSNPSRILLSLEDVGLNLDLEIDATFESQDTQTHRPTEPHVLSTRRNFMHRRSTHLTSTGWITTHTSRESLLGRVFQFFTRRRHREPTEEHAVAPDYATIMAFSLSSTSITRDTNIRNPTISNHEPAQFLERPIHVRRDAFDMTLDYNRPYTSHQQILRPSRDPFVDLTDDNILLYHEHEEIIQAPPPQLPPTELGPFETPSPLVAPYVFGQQDSPMLNATLRSRNLEDIPDSDLTTELSLSADELRSSYEEEGNDLSETRAFGLPVEIVSSEEYTTGEHTIRWVRRRMMLENGQTVDVLVEVEQGFAVQLRIPQDIPSLSRHDQEQLAPVLPPRPASAPVVLQSPSQSPRPRQIIYRALSMASSFFRLGRRRFVSVNGHIDGLQSTTHTRSVNIQEQIRRSQVPPSVEVNEISGATTTRSHRFNHIRHTFGRARDLYKMLGYVEDENLRNNTCVSTPSPAKSESQTHGNKIGTAQSLAEEMRFDSNIPVRPIASLGLDLSNI